MFSLNRKKFFDAIYGLLSETMTLEKATNQTDVYVDNMFDIVKDINQLIESNKDIEILSQKFHMLKGILLYGDFYYESDLCEDIEIELRKNKNIINIKSIYNDLIDNLKSD